MSMFTPVRMLIATQPSSTVQPVPYAGIPAGQTDTDPDFFYDPVTQTLNVLNMVFTDLTLSGDIEFTNDVNHSIFILQSADETVGRTLSIAAGEGGDADTNAAGNGGRISLLGGDGGAASVTDAAGVGGQVVISAGDGGAGAAAIAAGAGGNLDLSAGDGGTDGGGGGGNGGNVTINGGNATGAGTDGTVSIATSNTSILTLGASAVSFLVNSTNIEFSNAANHNLFAAQPTVAGTAGRNMTITGSVGAAATAGVPGAIGGQAIALGGVGGPGHAAQIAGQGGPANLTGGDAGANGGAGGNNGGNANVDAGAGTGAGVGGNVNIGTTVAANVNIGRAGQPTTINGALITAQGIGSDDTLKVFGDSPYVLLTTDYLVSWTTTGGACAQTLPALATVRGRHFYIVKATADANAVTITPNGAETISLAATLVLAGGAPASAHLYAPSAGTDWLVL